MSGETKAAAKRLGAGNGAARDRNAGERPEDERGRRGEDRDFERNRERRPKALERADSGVPAQRGAVDGKVEHRRRREARRGDHDERRQEKDGDADHRGLREHARERPAHAFAPPRGCANRAPATTTTSPIAIRIAPAAAPSAGSRDMRNALAIVVAKVG